MKKVLSCIIVIMLLVITVDTYQIYKLSNKNKTSHIKTVGCVARYNGKEWYLIDDEEHTPLHIKCIKTNSKNDFVIEYDFTASKVISLVATPDETYAINDCLCGASVGLEYSRILVREPEGIPEDIYNSANVWIYGVFEVDDSN